MDDGLFTVEPIRAATREDRYGENPRGDYSLTDSEHREHRETPGNDAEGRSRFITRARAVYEKARIREEEKPYARHQSASGLKAPDAAGRYEKKDMFNGRDAADLFQKIDALVTGNAAEFGTIAHACVEAALKHTAAFIPPFIAGKLDGAAAEKLLEAGEEIARRFLDSPLGKAAQSAAWAKTEFPFRTLERNVSYEGVNEGGKRDIFINGTIDLVFEKDGMVTIVDFKTDSTENPAEHTAQMAAYYRAAQDLWQKETRVFLYYLRSGNAVEMAL
jgi:ATP-dependent helicase/nuclease subunit A